jgi:hypothetical protein
MLTEREFAIVAKVHALWSEHLPKSACRFTPENIKQLEDAFNASSLKEVITLLERWLANHAEYSDSRQLAKSLESLKRVVSEPFHAALKEDLKLNLWTDSEWLSIKAEMDKVLGLVEEDKPVKRKKPHWTKEEDQLLAANCSRIKLDELCKLFPNRARSGVIGRLNVLKLSRKFGWLPEEDQRLRDACDTMTFWEIVKLFPNVGWMAVSKRIKQLGLEELKEMYVTTEIPITTLVRLCRSVLVQRLTEKGCAEAEQLATKAEKYRVPIVTETLLELIKENKI